MRPLYEPEKTPLIILWQVTQKHLLLPKEGLSQVFVSPTAQVYCVLLNLIEPVLGPLVFVMEALHLIVWSVVLRRISDGFFGS